MYILLSTLESWINIYRHAAEICNMALDLKAACGSVVRPDIAPRTIKIRAGIHTGYIYIVSSRAHLSHSFGKADGTYKTVGMI